MSSPITAIAEKRAIFPMGTSCPVVHHGRFVGSLVLTVELPKYMGKKITYGNQPRVSLTVAREE